MTVGEALRLNKGDCVFYKNNKYKVLFVKEKRSAASGEIYVEVKCRRGSETTWFSNIFIENISEEERFKD